MNEQPDTANIVFPEKDDKSWTYLVDEEYVNTLAEINECEPNEVASAMFTSMQLNK